MNGWTLDKNIPIAFILAFLVYAGSMFYWGGKMEGRVSTVERDQTRYSERLGEVETLVSRIDERTSSMKTDVQDIKDILNKR